MDEDWRNAFGILMCTEICEGAGMGICDGWPSTCSSLNLMLPWKPNKIATGHETHKWGRQLSNDHNCQIWFTSFHCL